MTWMWCMSSNKTADGVSSWQWFNLPFSPPAGLYTDEADVVHIFKAADGAWDRLKAFRKAEKSATARAAEAERQAN